MMTECFLDDYPNPKPVMLIQETPFELVWTCDRDQIQRFLKGSCVRLSV